MRFRRAPYSRQAVVALDLEHAASTITRAPRGSGVLSDAIVTIKSVPPTPQDTAAPQAHPLSVLTRSELGAVWASVLREAREAGELRSVRGAAVWLRRPQVREVLDEIKRRYWATIEEQDAWLNQLFDLPPE